MRLRLNCSPTSGNDVSPPLTRSERYGFGDTPRIVRLYVAVLLAATIGTSAQAQSIFNISAPAESRKEPPLADTPQPGLEMPGGSDQSGDISAVLGGTIWDGDFGTLSDTTITAVAATVRYQIDDLRISAQLPWMRISSAGTVFTGIGGTPLLVAPSVAAPRRVRRGMGDLTVGAAYLLASEDHLPFSLELSGRVKLPTASNSSGLSTGKTDYSVGLEVSRLIGPVIPALSVSHRFFGDPAGWNLRNGTEFTASVTVPFVRTGTIYAAYTYTEAASRMIADGQEITLGLSMPLFAERVRLTAIGGAGVSRGAADLMAGTAVTLTF